MVILHSYVSLPEGSYPVCATFKAQVGQLKDTLGSRHEVRPKTLGKGALEDP